MKAFYFWLAATIACAMWVNSAHAQVSCTTNTIILQDRVVTTTTCCTPQGYCTTTVI